uniref:ABC transporter ATP-binding protein n=1 Tax=Streptomyces sp. NRRL F-2747 TaxID=1463843 RepID=UPI0004C53C77
KSFSGPAGSQLVLDDISLDVAPGEFVTILGASGCGKSTLLNLVAGLDKPTAGTIETAGRPALMFQEHALFPWLTAGKNIELALRLRGVAKADRKPEAERLLELVRLGGAHDKRVHELSGGMRQRVALARALAQDSRLLLMDEPFAALDAITRDVLHGELTRIWAETHVSVLFVTHNVREAVRLAQRVVLLSSRPGRVAKEWTVDIPQPRRIEDAD